MPTIVLCANPACTARLSVADDMVGRPVKCTKCGTAFTAFASSVGISPPTASKTSPLPKTVGRYQIRAKLGAGAFGTVYRAYDPQLDREVALKLLNPDTLSSQQAVERFQREARAAARLIHAHIVPVYDAGQHDGHPFIAAAFIPGRTLSDAIPVGGLDPRQAVALVIQLADALAYAHEQGVLHRDVKPGNIMLDAKDRLFLMDFGLAGWLSQEETRITSVGAAMGTPSYMPPEQAIGDLDLIGPASDQYSACVVLYELLTGRLPFEGPAPIVIYHVLNTAPKRPSQHRQGLDSRLEMICLKALAKRPQDRYPSTEAFAFALRDWLSACPAYSSVPAVSSEPRPPALPTEGPVQWQEATAVPPPLPMPGSPPPLPGGSAKQNRSVSDKEKSREAESGQRPVAPKSKDHATARSGGQRVLRLKKPTPKGLRSPTVIVLLLAGGSVAFWFFGLPLLSRLLGPGASSKNEAAEVAGEDPLRPQLQNTQDEKAKEEAEKRRKAQEEAEALRRANEAEAVRKAEALRKALADAVQQELADDIKTLTKLALSGKGESDYLKNQSEKRLSKWREAADKGLAEGQYLFGRCYREGVGVPWNVTEAVNWYRRAADQGFAPSQNDLGECYYHGSGVARADRTLAVLWYQKAADQGFAMAQYHLGECYVGGDGGLTVSLPKAALWFRKAADQGSALAQYNLGWYYHHGGVGLEKDLPAAVGWYRKAAEQGERNAQNFLGICYEDGTAMEKDLMEAVRWYRKAADQQDMYGQYNLARHYESGTGGLSQNNATALDLYRKSAAQGSSVAQYVLGSRYERGLLGLTKDFDEAARWYGKAADQGHVDARKALDALLTKLYSHYLPDDSEVIVFARMNQLIATEFWKTLTKQVPAFENVDEIKKDLGFGFKDVDLLVAAGHTQGDVILVCRLNRSVKIEEILMALRQNKRELAPIKVGRYTMYASENSMELGVCVIDDKMVIYGQPKHLRAVLERDGPPRLLPALRNVGNLDEAQTALLALDPEIFLKEVRKQKPDQYPGLDLNALNGMVGLEMSAVVRADCKCRIVATCKDRDAAVALKKLCDQALQLARLGLAADMTQEKKDLLAELNKVKFSQTDNTVVAETTVTVALLLKLAKGS